MIVDEFKSKNKLLAFRSQSCGKINPFDALKPGNNFQSLLEAKIK